MTQRIAPNNQLPATHFIEVWSDREKEIKYNWDSVKELFPIDELASELFYSSECRGLETIAIFRIRENKLPTKHKFSK